MTGKERIINSYVNLIIKGKATIDQIPEKYRDEVAVKVSEILGE